MKKSKPIRMFAMVNCGVVKKVAYYRKDCVKWGKEALGSEYEYRRYTRNGWFKIVPCEVRLDAAGER